MRLDNKDLTDLMNFNVDTNELSLSLEAIENLFKFLAWFTKSRKVNYSKIRHDSRVHIPLNSSYFTEVFSVSKNIVKAWTRSLSLIAVPGLYSDVDLEKDKYEGGFKVWEGTCDLVKFITEDKDIIKALMDRETTLRVLELGAGSGLASISLISRLVYDRNFKSEYRIHLQDYNWEVLASLTLMNLALNLPRSYLEALIHTRCLRFFFGDWADFRNSDRYTYDLIMMSEVIYSKDSYQSLHDLLDRHLKRNGFVVMATKDTYFGLSGGLYSWLDYLEMRGIFTPYKIIKVSTTNIPRSILILSRVTRSLS